MIARQLTTSPVCTFFLDHWSAETGKAIEKRDRFTLEVLADTIKALMERFTPADQARATVIVARAEAGLRWLGDRRHA